METRKESRNSFDENLLAMLRDKFKELKFHRYLGLSQTNFAKFMEEPRFLTFASAFVHTSYANERNVESYERMEFLGDAFIYVTIAELIYQDFPDNPPNLLSTIRQKFVKTTRLSEVTKNIGMDKLVVTSPQLELPEFSKVFADIYEAAVGAIFLIFGRKKAFNFIKMTLYDKCKSDELLEDKDYKTTLQEFFQSISKAKFNYRHTRTEDGFSVQLIHGGKVYGTGVGRTKKMAEMQAAAEVLNKISSSELKIKQTKFNGSTRQRGSYPERRGASGRQERVRDHVVRTEQQPISIKDGGTASKDISEDDISDIIANIASLKL